MSRRHILAVTLLAVTSVADMPLRFLWNVTASAPVGLYTVEPADRLTVPELVAVMPPLLLGAEWSVWIYRALALLLMSPEFQRR